MLASLFPLLCQSVDWFEDLVGEQKAMSEVRSSELDKGLSSSNDPVEGRRTSWLLAHGRLRLSTPLGRCVAWTLRRSPGLGIGSNYPRGLRFVFLMGRNKLVIFRPGRCASTSCFPMQA